MRLTEDEHDYLRGFGPGGAALGRLDRLSREDTLALVERFSNAGMLMGGFVPERKRLIDTKVLPVLREACRQHGVPIPDWLREKP